MTGVRRALIAVGACVMTFAVAGALTDADVTAGALVFLIGALLAHDAVLLPLTIGAGAVVGRLVPQGRHGLVRAALVISLAVTVVAFPLVLGRGRAPDNPSVLPLHYGRGLLEVYGAVWTAVAVGALVRRRRPSDSKGRS